MSQPQTGRPDAGPWGDARDLEACRAAVERADGRGIGGLLAMLLLIGAIGASASVIWLVSARFLPSWLGGSGPSSMLAAPVVAKKATAARKLVTVPPSALTPARTSEVR
jgi:hypothetical protein